MVATEDDQARELQNLKRQKLREQQADLAEDRTKKSGTKRQQVQDLKNLDSQRQNIGSSATGATSPKAKTSSKIFQALKKAKKNKATDQSQKKGGIELGLIGGILFIGYAMASIGLDLLPLITLGASPMLDWILDAMLGIYGGFMILIITGDPFEALIGRRQVLNLIGWGLESIPLLDYLPFHILVAIIIWLDFKYNIVSKIKNIKSH